MLLKCFGAALIVAGCGGCGFYMAYNYRKEEQQLRQLQRILERMINELSYRASPLPQLMRMVSESATGELAAIVLELAEELELQLAPDASFCMKAVLSRHSGLSGAARGVLELLGESLGQFDLSGQLRELEVVVGQCGHFLEEHERNRESRIRNYQTLGLCAGAALVILFL